MSITKELQTKVLQGGYITRDEALLLAVQPLEEVCEAADQIRRAVWKEEFDLCAVVSVKGGQCSENCRFCAQSTCAKVPVEHHVMMDTESLKLHARQSMKKGIRHYCLVSNGRRVSDKDIEKIVDGIRWISEKTELTVCTSFGLLQEEQFRRLKEAGVKRIHNNLETSRRYFPTLCTSHTYDEKIATIRAARIAGLEVCSGGIFGVGETMEDRIDMALTLRELDVQSVPINMLDPVPGTPTGEYPVLTKDEVRRIVALYRFLLPKQYIRLAAGRDYLLDSGFSCFASGANAAITGDMLTVKGISVEEDIQKIHEMGYIF